MRSRRRSVLTAASVGLALVASVASAPAGGATADRQAGTSDRFASLFPDTSNGIHVFDDQLPTTLSSGLLAFEASHYDGSQKDPANLVDQLHAANPAFVVVQYRLGIGLGYRASVSNCDQAGGYLYILDGNQWIREWPQTVQEEWFFHRGGQRVYSCQNGWFVTDVADPAYRAWFLGQLSQQIADTHTDGAFLDSVSVPNYLASGDAWKPPLPAIDPRFESKWSKKIGSWLPWITTNLAKPVIVNAGEWVTSRDQTDYSGATGVMVEGFAEPCDGCPYAASDWALEMDRTLSEVNLGRVVIGQTYPSTNDVQMRMFALGSYLLVKGSHTFLNLEIGFDPEWFPEYGIDLGPAVDPVPSSISDLLSGGVYVRRYTNGVVVVNAGSSNVTYSLGGTMYRVLPVGGGTMPQTGIVPPSWKLTSTAVTSVTLHPQEAAVMLTSPPGA